MMIIGQQIKVLFCVWELDPFLKVGGLGELARSLPRALKSRGIDIRVVIPKYAAIKFHHKRKKNIGVITVPYRKKLVKVRVYQTSFLNTDIPVYLIENKKYLDQVIPETFPIFSAAIAEGLVKNVFDWQPDILHCNDCHTGIVPLFVNTRKLSYKTLLTIHSIHNQGRSPIEYATNLGIPEAELSLMAWEIKKKKFNQLLEGIVNADAVNTVSPTYAQEIMYEPDGYDLESAIRLIQKQGKYFAILNGIDYALKDPRISPGVKFGYDEKTAHSQKQKNKKAFQQLVGFPTQKNAPLVGFIGRLDNSQKGIDRLFRMLWRLGNNGMQFVVMGKGEKAWEERFTTLAAFHPKNIKVYTRYDEEMATTIYTACDFILVPSNFEPCGQVQMNAMRYGALPIVRETGGLTDTVKDSYNGFVYDGNSSFDLERTLKRAVKLAQMQPETVQTMVRNAMKTDNSWNASAASYHALYASLLTGNTSQTKHLRAGHPLN